MIRLARRAADRLDQPRPAQRAAGLAVAALAVVDMVKGLDRSVVIEDVRIVAKSGGRSGDWVRPGEAGPQEDQS